MVAADTDDSDTEGPKMDRGLRCRRVRAPHFGTSLHSHQRYRARGITKSTHISIPIHDGGGRLRRRNLTSVSFLFKIPEYALSAWPIAICASRNWPGLHTPAYRFTKEADPTSCNEADLIPEQASVTGRTTIQTNGTEGSGTVVVQQEAESYEQSTKHWLEALGFPSRCCVLLE